MRFRLRTLLIVLAVLPPLLAGSWWAWRTKTRDHPVVELHSDRPTSTPATPYQAHDYYKRLFANSSSELLLTMTRHHDPSVALRAEWIRALSERIASEDGSDVVDVSHFLSQVERRLEVKAPPRWRAIVAQANPQPSGAVSFSRYGESILWGAEREIVNPVTSDDVAIQGNVIAVHFPDRSVAILKLGPDDPLLPTSDSGFRALARKEKVFLAAYDDSAIPFQLVCFDEPQARREWHADVWANGGFVSHTGRGFHYVELSIEDGRVYVFGAANDGVYIEGFAAGSGQCILRFSTAY